MASSNGVAMDQGMNCAKVGAGWVSRRERKITTWEKNDPTT